MKSNIIAREWLILLGALALGLIIVPIIHSIAVSFVIDEPIRLSGIRGYYSALLGGQSMFLGWALILIPYVMLQFARSVIWAVKVTWK